MVTYTGTTVEQGFGAPTLRDMAVQLSRICRYAGACKLFWTVAQHSLVVGDLLPKKLRIHGLIHDSTECCFGDITSPFKTDDLRLLEKALLRRIYEHLYVLYPSEEEVYQIKTIDRIVLGAEAKLFGPSGFNSAYPELVALSTNHAEARISHYLQIPEQEWINPHGTGPKLYYQELTTTLYEYWNSLLLASRFEKHYDTLPDDLPVS